MLKSVLLCFTLVLAWASQSLATPQNGEYQKMLDEPTHVQALIEQLQLAPHVEGGYYRRTFQADHREQIGTEFGPRYSMTSIFYLLTKSSPVGHFHKNRSDIMHVFHQGSPITYYLIHPDGTLETRTLGNDLSKGHELQFVVKGGVWKASSIKAGSDFGLITEVVAPGFDFADMTLAKQEKLLQLFPQHEEIITKHTR